MCTHCGCGTKGAPLYNSQAAVEAPGATPDPADAHTHAHGHDHHDHCHCGGDVAGHPPHHDHSHCHDAHGHHHDHPHHHHTPTTIDSEDRTARMIRIEEDILSRNNELADVNRAWFQRNRVTALNLVSSPGSGKTTLLVETVRRLKERLPIAVIEGDQQTEFDAERIRQTGVPALQINTGKGCHLDAQMIGQALLRLDVEKDSLLMIENVGNLVCPAAFDLGEDCKVVILSVTEGEDKPLKYPDMFAAAELMIISKIDLLPHLDFDIDKVTEYARRINPDIAVLRLATTTGEGFEDWLTWIDGKIKASGQAR